jgi:putative two-component system response regulator
MSIMSQSESQLGSPPVPTTSERRTKTRIDPTKAAHHDAIFTLARASESHDEDTGAHVLRIREIVEQLALRTGFAPDDATELGYDAMLHDVGKLRIPAAILKKPDGLTANERTVMESHTVRGELLLIDRPTMRRAAAIARSHHESWDGQGYPDRIQGEAIPLAARITAAADVLDALIADRCYKQAWSYDDAMREVISLAGTKLDPRVIEALGRCNADGSLRAIFGLPAQCAQA